jgi:phenylalanine-4-hydroxylase
MFDEAQLYAPVTVGPDSAVTVHLGDDHPGVGDPTYRERRNAIAALAMQWTPGKSVPHVDYTDEEHHVWAVVCRELAVLHETLACNAYLEGAQLLKLPTDHVPQLDEVSETLAGLTGFRYAPAAGLVELRTFYESLADSLFHSTQYVRHHSVPLYTPEPDVIHEVVGHGNCLAHPRFAALYRSAGEAARRVESQESLEFVSKVFWFSLEFGVLREDDRVKTYGAGLLSSYGEIQEIARADLRPLDISRMGVQTYDITHYQPLLFCAESFDEIEDVVGGFFDTVDDDVVARMMSVGVR